MKKLFLFAVLISLVFCGLLRKETAQTAEKSQVHYVKADIAEPIKYENQYHSGEDIAPEIVYGPVEFRFKETESVSSSSQLQKNQKALGKMAPGVTYSTVETIHAEPESEGGYFSPEIVGARFKEIESRKKKDTRKAMIEAKEEPEEEHAGHHDDHHEEEAASAKKVEVKQVAKQQAKSTAAFSNSEREYESVQNVAQLSQYSQEDLKRLAKGEVRIYPLIKSPDSYAQAPLIYHHVVDSSQTPIVTAISPLTEDKKNLWHDFIPQGGVNFGDVRYQNEARQQPVTLLDETGQPREFYNNIKNYGTSIQVGPVLNTPSLDVDSLTNVANTIKDRQFDSTYDHSVTLNNADSSE